MFRPVKRNGAPPRVSIAPARVTYGEDGGAAIADGAPTTPSIAQMPMAIRRTRRTAWDDMCYLPGRGADCNTRHTPRRAGKPQFARCGNPAERADCQPARTSP